jgi:hypothetical protein
MTGGYIGKSMAKQMPYLPTSATLLQNVTALQVITLGLAGRAVTFKSDTG